jgi:hypothetical protein
MFRLAGQTIGGSGDSGITHLETPRAAGLAGTKRRNERNDNSFALLENVWETVKSGNKRRLAAVLIVVCSIRSNTSQRLSMNGVRCEKRGLKTASSAHLATDAILLNERSFSQSGQMNILAKCLQRSLRPPEPKDWQSSIRD